VLWDENKEYVEAFTHFHYRRQHNLNGVPLPFMDSEMLAYCEMRGVINRPRFHSLICQVDKAWLNWKKE